MMQLIPITLANMCFWWETRSHADIYWPDINHTKLEHLFILSLVYVVWVQISLNYYWFWLMPYIIYCCVFLASRANSDVSQGIASAECPSAASQAAVTRFEWFDWKELRRERCVSVEHNHIARIWVALASCSLAFLWCVGGTWSLRNYLCYVSCHNYIIQLANIVQHNQQWQVSHIIPLHHVL